MFLIGGWFCSMIEGSSASISGALKGSALSWQTGQRGTKKPSLYLNSPDPETRALPSRLLPLVTSVLWPHLDRKRKQSLAGHLLPRKRSKHGRQTLTSGGLSSVATRELLTNWRLWKPPLKGKLEIFYCNMSQCRPASNTLEWSPRQIIC